MKYLAIIISLIIFTTKAYALSCACLTPEEMGMIEPEIPNIFLVKIQSVTHNPPDGCRRSGTGAIEILKIYKGDIETIKQIKQLNFSGGSHAWPSGCTFPGLISKDDKWLIKSHNHNKANVWLGGDICGCGGGETPIDDAAISEFEQTHQPIWIKPE